ncbi:titin homolog isoform X2 [Schistocerca cancellata]|uniref:titin homolog isoform X2 n=1 Tax=Schistocerca cancellata TaxID=274614 RepID=UPI0021179553|nr:titin homolog isoform X2 [Schistocerca cancellata]
MARARGGALPLPLLAAATVLLLAAAGASFLQCDDHLGSCEPEPGPGDEPVLSRLLPAAGSGGEGRGAAQPAVSRDDTEERRESDTARQRTPVATAAKQRTDTSSIVNRGQAVTSEPEALTQSGVSKDILKHRHGEDSSAHESPVAAADLPKTSAGKSPTRVIPPASVAQPSVPQQSNVTEKMPEGSSENQVKVLVEQRNVASKTERQPTVVPSGSKSRRKREVASDVPDRAAAVPSGKSGVGAGQSRRLQTESPREDSGRAQKSASEGERKAVGKSVSSVTAGGNEGTSKPSTSTVKTAQDLPPAPNVIKEAHKQNKHVTEKQDRHVENVEHIHRPDVLKHAPQKASPASSDSKVNANTVNKYQSVKSQKPANNGGSSSSEDAMPKKSTQSQSHGNGQKEVIKRFRSSEESHGARKAQKTHPVKSQDSHQQENLQGKTRKSTGSTEGKHVSEAKSKTVVGPNKISSGVYRAKVKDPSSKLSNVAFGEHQAANNKVTAPTIRKTQHTLVKLKNNDTSQLNQDANMQIEKQRVRREIGDHSTFSVSDVSEDSKLDTDHFGEMHLNETVKNATVKKVTFSNRSSTVDDSYKTASTTIIVDGNLFRGSGSKTWKLSSTVNTSQNEVSREASVEGKSTKLPDSTFTESKNISSETSNRSVISAGNRVNTTEIDKSKKLEDSPEVPIAPSSYESGLKSASFSTSENTESDLQVNQAQAEQTNSSRDKSTDVRENSADVPPEEQAPVSSPSRGEMTLRIKRETAPEVKTEIGEENMRDEVPPLVTDPITNINAENQSQEIESVSSESDEVKKLKEDDTKSTAALSGRMQSVKTEVIENGTDSRSEQSTDEKQKESGEEKNEESVSNDALHIPDTGINSSESVVTVAVGLPNQKITKREPVPQRLVSFQEKENCDKGGKSLTESVATEESGMMKGGEEEVSSAVATERSEEPKGAHPSVINEGARELSSVSGADKPVVAKETDKGTVAGEGEPQRGGGPVAEAIQSQPPEDDTHSADPPESEPKAQTGDSSGEAAVAEKWVMPESSGRVEERGEEAVQPQPQLLEDSEDSERLLVLADRLRQRDGGRRDAEEERGRDRERDRLDEPQLHFPSVPAGEDFHAAKLGLSDGIFLFGYLSTFISWLQPQDFPVELVRDALWNRISLTDLITETLQVEVGFIAVLSVGVALALAVPLTALGLTCCRLLEARADAGRDLEPSACRRRSLLCGLWTVLLLMAVGVAAMFASNEQVSAAVQWSPRVLHTALSDTAAFVRSTHHQIGFVASKSLDQALAAAVEDLDSADALLGAPIQRELSRETGVDVALDALSDVSAAAEGASQRAAAVLEQAAQARGLALVARERLADLRYQLDAARRQCAARDRPLCDTVDAVGLDVSVRLEALLTDERLLALRDLRNGNLSAAAQQARADFQLLPRQVLESTRDARLGIRRELVRERAQLQESLSPLDAFSRSVSGRVDGARAAAQDAARVVAEADYWRWLVGLGSALSMLVLWLLLAAGGGCGCCGSQEKARPLLITAVATASALSVVLWAVTLVAFALGAHGEVLACRPLFSAPDYPQLSRLLDRPGVLFPAGGFFRNVAGSNASLDVPLKDVLQECELGRPAYQALQLRQLFDSDAATGRGGQWEGVRQQVSRLRVDLAELRVLTPGLQAQLEDTLQAASANLTLHRLALQGPVTARDLQALADQLLSVSSQVADLSSASRLETLAARAKRLLSSHISPLEQRKEDLVYRLTALEVALSPLQRQTNQSLSHLKTIQYFVSKQGESIADAAVRHYADRLLSYLQQARTHVLAQVGRHVAPCRPLFDVFHAARQLLCRHALDPLNGLWFSSAWCLVLLVAAVPLSLRLADAYRRRDSSASLLSSRNSEWQVEKSSKDYY